MSDILSVFVSVFTIENILLVFGGAVLGTVFGAIPGLNTPIAVALVLPFTLVMPPIPSVALIMGVYMGGVAGGLVSAILLKIPGTAASVATTFDGYPMTLKGKSTEALQVAVFSSFFGGVFSALMLFLLAPLLSKIAIGFGPWEYFGTSVFALSLVCALSKGNLVKGFIATLLGLLIKTVGMSPVDGVASRFTFGSYNLENGFNIIAIVIGVFALPEIINNSADLAHKLELSKFKKMLFYMPGIKDIKRLFGILMRSSIIGTIIGILPGMGGGPAGMIAYSQAQKTSKRAEEYGKGCDEGVAASESANNATTGGALITMLSLGVPGDTVTAIILGAFMIQGIPTGPALSISEPLLFRSIILLVFLANIAMFIVMAMNLGWVSKVATISRVYLIPLVGMFCVTGIISVNNNIFDAIYAIGFVILGYILDRNAYPIAPLILGVILGGIVEDNLRRSLVYYGTFVDCLKQPTIGTLFVLIAIAVPIYYAFSNYRETKKAKSIKG